MMNSLTKQQCQWPDPALPGRPLNAEQEGPHWLRYEHDGYAEISAFLWERDGYWVKSRHVHYSEWVGRWNYLGPCLRPDEAVTALLREVQLKAALREMVYEATHLSPQEDDGSHWAKISKRTLDKARAALKDEPFP
jgi:hypothetical protein